MSGFALHHMPPASGLPSFSSSLNSSGQGGRMTPILPHESGITGKRRKISKAKVSPILKRAVSTPHMSGLSDQDTPGLSPSALDKRRNKLGYQRISIACGHCRRRKIRCVLAEQDDMGRCQNCIRLKKECVFYPVDSTGGTESRAQHKAGSGSKASSIMSDSPSERKFGALIDGERDIGRSFPPLASNAPRDLSSTSSGSGLGISTASMNSQEYAYEHSDGARDGIYSGISSHADSANSDASTTASWRLQDSPRVHEFPAFSPSEAHSSGFPNYSYAATRGEYAMQPPMRSISYGNIEPALNHFQQPSTSASMGYSRHEPTPQYPLTPTNLHHAQATNSALDPVIAPMAPDGMPQYGIYPQQQPWQYVPQVSQPGGLDYARHDSVNMQWYPHQLPQGIEQQGRPVQFQQHPQQWQQHRNGLMPPPDPGYSKGHSPV
ncbi:hypothetical protein AAFC00_001504 [Neodothiora populina]|uniref:Zn(2)-C6 fungal-type domain-containing protein n=1 Tax=Neodothiora populina TaxID=2781224 RepID=A0ABR3PP41_9PEZI